MAVKFGKTEDTDDYSVNFRNSVEASVQDGDFRAVSYAPASWHPDHAPVFRLSASRFADDSLIYSTPKKPWKKGVP